VNCVGRDGTGPVRLGAFECAVEDTGLQTWSARGVPVT
jgi:hypothetical protein